MAQRCVKTVEVLPMLIKHQIRHVDTKHCSKVSARLELTEQKLGKATSARKHWEELLQAATRKHASSSAGRWILMMELIGVSQNPDARKNVLENLDWHVARYH